MPTALLRSEAEVKFETYRYYLQCLVDCLKSDFERWEDLGTAVVAKTRKLQGMKAVDEAWLRRFLKIAWNTEYLLSLGAEDSELLRINNQWAPIQCYYAIYAAAEAAAYVIDGEPANSHATALGKCTDYFRQRGLSPWNRVVTGPLGKDRQGRKLENFPADTRVPHNLARSGVQPHEMIAKCLHAEHQHRIDESWSRKKKVRKYEYDPGPTSLLHFLYRLRIKSNYKDVDIFVSMAPEEHVRGFAKSLGFICFRTLLYLEAIVIARAGKARVLAIVDEYRKMNNKAERLEKRMNFFRATV